MDEFSFGQIFDGNFLYIFFLQSQTKGVCLSDSLAARRFA